MAGNVFSCQKHLVLASLLAIARAPVHAAPSNNPIFATIQDVQNAINAALAPIQNAIADLQTQQANQATQISSLQNSVGQSLKVFDANGQELGLLVGHAGSADTIFIESISKFMVIDENGGIIGRTNAFYQSSDCTGTPYVSADTALHGSNDVFQFSPQLFYIVNASDTPISINVKSDSYWSDSSNSMICSPFVQTFPYAYQLHPVSLPFSTPIALPYQIKYQ